MFECIGICVLYGSYTLHSLMILPYRQFKRGVEINGSFFITGIGSYYLEFNCLGYFIRAANSYAQRGRFKR